MENKELNIIANDKIKEEYKKSLNGIIDGVKTGYASIDKPWLSIYSKEEINNPLPKMSVLDYLYINNKNNMSDYALNYFGSKVTYEEMFKRINKANKAFQSLGVKPGDTVAICCANTPEIVYIFYALSELGAVADIIDPRINANVMRKYLEDSNANVFMCLDVSLPRYQEMLEELDDIKYVINLPVLGSMPYPMRKMAEIKAFLDSKFKNVPMPDKIKDMPKGVINYKDFMQMGLNNSIMIDPYRENKPVAILHTGGTTGIPKGAVLSHDNLNALVEQLKRTELEFYHRQKWLSLMPPCVSYGLANGMHLSLCCGMESILIPTYEPEKIDKQILQYHPNRLTCSPAHWEYFEKSKLLDNKDLSFIINPIEGGDSLNVNLERKCNEKLAKNGCTDRLNKGYGLTETCAALCVASPKIEDNELLIGSIGYPLCQTVISIFETDELTGEIKELGYNEIGEICASAPQVMLKYHNNEEETSKTLKVHSDGKTWIHTGDLGYMTPDGRLFHKGRSKRIVIRFDGTKVYPFDIESVIGRHPAVALAAVVGIQDKDHIQGRLPKAYITLKEEYKDNISIIKEIEKLCEDNLIDYMLPVEYEIIDTMPKTPLGKLDFTNLENRNNIIEKDYTKTLKK